jgi:hypothetical protein
MMRTIGFSFGMLCLTVAAISTPEDARAASAAKRSSRSSKTASTNRQVVQHHPSTSSRSELTARGLQKQVASNKGAKAIIAVFQANSVSPGDGLVVHKFLPVAKGDSTVTESIVMTPQGLKKGVRSTQSRPLGLRERWGSAQNMLSTGSQHVEDIASHDLARWGLSWSSIEGHLNATAGEVRTRGFQHVDFVSGSVNQPWYDRSR